MPRKRMIDPEFWSDEEIGTWSFGARLFYIGLWNFADDEGKFKANDALLKAQIFPYDQDVDLEEIKAFLGGKITWYECEKLKYGYIRNFIKYQRIDRPTPSKLPNPPSGLDESSTSPRGSLDPNIREDKLSKEPTDLLTSIKTKPEYAVYQKLPLETEFGKMSAWLAGRPGRKMTKRFVLNWLNKCLEDFVEQPTKDGFGKKNLVL